MIDLNGSLLLLFSIVIMRQWCLECILNFEGSAKTIDFMLHRDLLDCRSVDHSSSECVVNARYRSACIIMNSLNIFTITTALRVLMKPIHYFPTHIFG